MSNHYERLSRFWEELKRRKVILIYIAYLAAQLANFIGRELELPLVRQLIKDHCLLTLIGAGRNGQSSRLAQKSL